MQNPHQSAKLIKRISILKRINIYCLQTKRYLKFGVWFYDTQNLPLWKRRSIEGYKILAVAYKKFVQDQCIERSSSLSFYSLMAIVPILAMAFGFAGGFGMTTVLQNLLSNFTPSDAPFWNLILNFSQNMLSNVNGGLIAGIGILVLFWIVMNVITRIEKALNEIWQVKKARTFLRKATDYTTIIVLTPMLLFVAFSAKIYLSAHLQELVNISFFQSFIHIILSTTPIIITFIIIILLYFILPNMRIPLFSAIISGIFSSLLFLLVQSLYVKFQVYMTSYNLIYGSFAALPLFMLWLRFSWIILLLGAELGFSIENYHHYIFETDYKHLSEYRRKIYALFTVNQLVRNFAQRQGAMSVQEIATKIRAPQPYIFQIVHSLTETGILNRIHTFDPKKSHETLYQPAFDINTMKLSDILNALELYDYNEEFKPENSKAYSYFEQQLQKLNDLVKNSPQNILIKDMQWEELPSL